MLRGNGLGKMLEFGFAAVAVPPRSGKVFAIVESCRQGAEVLIFGAGREFPRKWLLFFGNLD
jgi:hypothetical protein